MGETICMNRVDEACQTSAEHGRQAIGRLPLDIKAIAEAVSFVLNGKNCAEVCRTIRWGIVTAGIYFSLRDMAPYVAEVIVRIHGDAAALGAHEAGNAESRNDTSPSGSRSGDLRPYGLMHQQTNPVFC